MQLGPRLHVFSLSRILFPQPSCRFHGVKICVWRNLTFLYKRLIFLCPEQPQFGGYLSVQLLYSNFLVKNYILNTYFSHASHTLYYSPQNIVNEVFMERSFLEACNFKFKSRYCHILAT